MAGKVSEFSPQRKAACAAACSGSASDTRGVIAGHGSELVAPPQPAVVWPALPSIVRECSQQLEYKGLSQKEISLADNPKQQNADAQFKKQQRAEDGKKAMTEYEANAVAVRVQMAKLRELRLARDAAAPAAAPPAKKAVKKDGKKDGKKKGAAAAPLSSWLQAREDGGHKN